MGHQFLTTTQAAKLCNVTRFTIRNWVNSGRLKARKTAGGHRRIARDELLKFVKENGLAKIGRRDAGYLIPRCWEYHNLKGKRYHNCTGCLVFKEKADKCFLLVREFGSEKIRCLHDCSVCEYLKKHYPREAGVIARMNADSIDYLASGASEEDIAALKGALRKGLYTSGKYFASLTKILSRDKHKSA